MLCFYWDGDIEETMSCTNSVTIWHCIFEEMKLSFNSIYHYQLEKRKIA